MCSCIVVNLKLFTDIQFEYNMQTLLYCITVLYYTYILYLHFIHCICSPTGNETTWMTFPPIHTPKTIASCIICHVQVKRLSSRHVHLESGRDLEACFVGRMGRLRCVWERLLVTKRWWKVRLIWMWRKFGNSFIVGMLVFCAHAKDSTWRWGCEITIRSNNKSTKQISLKWV